MFNPDQEALINAPLTKKVTGIAGAGTGKTTTVLGRCVRVLNEFTVGNVVLVTFTRAAAKDLKEKLAEKLTEPQLKRIKVGTFHSLMADILRKKASLMGFNSRFTILSPTSTNTLIRQIIEADDELMTTVLQDYKNGEYYDPSNPKMTGKIATSVADSLSKLINHANPDDLFNGIYDLKTIHFVEKGSRGIKVPTLHDIFRRSLEKALENQVMTYDHILFLTYLLGREGGLEEFKESAAYIFCDEYQDTNALQDAFVRFISDDNLTLIGDIDQAIYAFRGGQSDFMINHANEGDVVNLHINYRSYQPILDVANNIIKNNNTGRDFRRPLIAAKALDEEFEGVHRVRSSSTATETTFLVESVQKLLNRGIMPNDIAVLVRDRRLVAPIKKAFHKANVSLNDQTKFADFMSSDVVKDMLNYLQVMVNPKDSFAFLNIINRPKRGIGIKSTEKLLNNAREEDMSVIEYLLSDHIYDLSPALQKNSQDVRRIYQELQRIAQDNNRTLTDVVNLIYQISEYEQWINDKKDNKTDKENIRLLKDMVKEFDTRYEQDYARGTLYDRVLDFTDEMSIKETANIENVGVLLTTEHSSKGLEWDYVFVIGMEQGTFPSQMALQEGSLEDERNLAYVTVTRARKMLVICEAMYRQGFEGKLEPSQFMREAYLNVTFENY